MVARLPIREFDFKAGGAGSSPDDAAMTPNPTQPLKYFLGQAGNAIANLNSTVVGLDAIEKNYEKPDSLNISWNPTNRKIAARKARRFVLEAVLVRVSEALKEYILAISKLPRFDRCREKWKKDTPIAEKLSDISEAALEAECYLTVGSCLLVHWRNRAVHPNSNAALTKNQISTFQMSSTTIAEKFAGLSIDKLLKDFEEGKPTLKDISSLVSMSILWCRKLDNELNDLSEEDLHALLSYYGLERKIAQLERETSPNRINASIIQYLKTTAPGLAKTYEKFHKS